MYPKEVLYLRIGYLPFSSVRDVHTALEWFASQNLVGTIIYCQDHSLIPRHAHRLYYSGYLYFPYYKSEQGIIIIQPNISLLSEKIIGNNNKYNNTRKL